MEIRLSSLVTGADVNDAGEVVVRFLEKEEEQEFVCDKLIVAVGRQPNTEKLLPAIVQLNWTNEDFCS